MNNFLTKNVFRFSTAASLLLAGCGATTPDTWFGGSFDAAVHTKQSDAAWALRCESEKSCQMSYEVSEPDVPARKEIFDLMDVPLVKDLTPANAALDYVKNRKKDQDQEQPKIRDEDMDARLLPLLESNTTIEECAELDAKRLGYGMLCRLKQSPWKTPTILLISANIGCCGCSGSYTCQYPIIPLQGTWSQGTKDSKTANAGKWSIFK